MRYVVGAGVDGAFLECGVWKGGSMFVVADTLLSLGVRDRDLYLFDTFSGMPPPTDEDVDAWGTQVADYYDAAIAEPFFNRATRHWIAYQSPGSSMRAGRCARPASTGARGAAISRARWGLRS